MGSRNERKACSLGDPPGGCGKQKKKAKTRNKNRRKCGYCANSHRVAFHLELRNARVCVLSFSFSLLVHTYSAEACRVAQGRQLLIISRRRRVSFVAPRRPQHENSTTHPHGSGYEVEAPQQAAAATAPIPHNRSDWLWDDGDTAGRPAVAGTALGLRGGPETNQVDAS